MGKRYTAKATPSPENRLFEKIEESGEVPEGLRLEAVNAAKNLYGLARTYLIGQDGGRKVRVDITIRL